MRIGIVAGEASGDLLGAKLIAALKVADPLLQVEGVGGPAMIEAGCKSLFDMERLAVMGLIEPLKRLPDLFKLRRDLYQHFITNPPDVFIGIDAPDFNLGLELKLRNKGIKTIHYVSPSVWAWRQRRIHKIAKAVDMMLTLLPFEAAFYEKHQVPVRYVGHPLASQIPMQIDVKAARRSLNLDEGLTYIALLPGSRSQEIRYLAEPFLRAAYLAWKARPNLRFVTSHINEKRYQAFAAFHKEFAPDLPLTFYLRKSQEVMAASNVVLVTSGTATLETMLYKKPMIIAYRMSPITYQLAKYLVKTPFIGLPNIIAQEMLVPELIQDAVTPEKIVEQLFRFLDQPKLIEHLQNKFNAIHNELNADSATRIRDAVMSVIRQ